MKNLQKAMFYVMIGWVFALASGICIGLMWFSGTFLPVYVAGEFVLMNRVLRYGLYLLLIAIFCGNIWLVCYGAEYLIDRYHKWIRRR